MNMFFRRFFACFLIFSLAVNAGASVLGEVLNQTTLPLSPESSLTESIYRDNAGRLRNEQVLTYTPGGDLLPSVVYGNTLYGRTPMDTMEAYPQAWGFSVVAGINGSFFDMDNGIPYGCVITGGAVRSSGNLEAVGFRKDGSAVLGVPGLSVKMTFPSGENPMEVHVNKALTKTGGMVLYTRDYDSRTKNTISAFNLVLQPDAPDLTLGETLVCTVTDILPNTADCPIPSGGFVLSMATETSYPGTLENLLKPLEKDQVLTLTVSVDEAWRDVVSACAGMEMLVVDGQLDTEYLLSSANTRTARTAVGLKADGSLVFYTVDSGKNASGLTLNELGKRMLELGCVTALNLDGGGSTAIRALYPGMSDTQTVNRPADGALRRCANFLFLTRPQTQSGPVTRLFAYPHNAMALPGGQIPLTVTATDENYIPAPVPDAVTFQSTGGVVENGVFTAQTVGDAKINLFADGASGGMTVRVIGSPDSIRIHQPDGSSVYGSMVCGESVDLSATAEFAGKPLYASDRSFVWTCSESIGTIDENGVFTAKTGIYVPQKGEISCAAGDTVRTLVMTVLPDNPFPDTETHWAKEQIRFLYDKKILTGSNIDGIPHFRPDDNMTRQEFLVSLSRYLGLEETDAVAEFADGDRIASWAKPAVNAAFQAGYLTGSMENGVLYCHPESPITRQEAMVILSRTLPETEVPADLLTSFPDADAVADWAVEGLGRMVSYGVISGMGDGTLNPGGAVTRAQVAKMLTALWTLPPQTAPDVPVTEEPATETPEGSASAPEEENEAPAEA